MHHGSCLCGGVAYEITGPLTPPIVCHCGQCRKQSGHVWSATNVAEAEFKLTRQDSLRWYNASDIAKRGFCANCGSFLFWKRHGASHFAISMGSLDAPTGLTLDKHIFTTDKGDYYQIADGLPQLETT